MPPSRKVAVVTGGAKGIGRAISCRLAQRGIAVAVWDRNPTEAHAVVAEIEASGGRAVGCVGDASKASDIHEMAAQTRSVLGPIHVLVNNAGKSGFGSFSDVTTDLLQDMLNANLFGPFLCTQEIIGDMVTAKWGRIINITSVSAHNGGARSSMAHYVTSKAALTGLTKALAMEYAPHGITANNIPPGLIDTPMLRRTGFDLDIAAARFPVGRIGKPDDVAAACAYLVSDDAGFITGQTIAVNGGQYLT